MTASCVQVSVLIPVLDEEAHLLEAAHAILSQQLDEAAEFLFIDGGSRDASLEILGSLRSADPRVRVLANPARRTPQALNIGLRAARGEFVARMDAHTIYPERYLASGVARLRAGGVDWVSGPQLAVGTNRGSRLVARALSVSLGTGGARFRDALQAEHDADTGFTGIWRRETLEAQGGWDEEWLNDQDTELAARIRKAGGRIVCIPEMAAHYVPRDTLRRLAHQYAIYGLYRVKTARRHPETLRLPQLVPPSLLLTLLASLAVPNARLRAMARLGLLAYAMVLLTTSVRAGKDGKRGDALRLPLVWTTMHLAYGIGFAGGVARHGPPAGAVLHLARQTYGRARGGRP
jgi:succinoglycan biosynthesis protein ExoA